MNYELITGNAEHCRMAYRQFAISTGHTALAKPAILMFNVLGI